MPAIGDDQLVVFDVPAVDFCKSLQLINNRDALFDDIAENGVESVESWSFTVSDVKLRVVLGGFFSCVAHG